MRAHNRRIYIHHRLYKLSPVVVGMIVYVQSIYAGIKKQRKGLSVKTDPRATAPEKKGA